MSTADALSKFESLLLAAKDDYASVDLRAIGIQHGDVTLCILAQGLLTDLPVGEVEIYGDLFSADDVVLLEEVLPLEKLHDLLETLRSGTIRIAGKELRLGSSDSDQLNAHCNELTSFWLGPRTHKEGTRVAISGSGELQRIIDHEDLLKLERRLGGYGKGYKNLGDLAACFIPGHDLAGNSRPEVQLLAPINVEARGRFHEKSVELAVEVGRLIKRDRLRFVAILRDEFNSRHSTFRSNFKVLPKGWKPTKSGFRSQVIIPRRDEKVCELLMVYGGQTVKTHFEGLYNQNFQTPPQEQGSPQPPLKPGQTDELVLMAVDFAGSTKLKQRLGADTARPLLDDWEAHVRGVVPIYGGYVMKWGGDGGLACFWGERKNENAYAAAQHVLYYPLARKTRPIAGEESVKVRIALHSGLIKWEKDTGSIKSRDIDVVCHAEAGLEPPNSIAASETFLKKCPRRITQDFRAYKKSDGERFLRTDFATIASTLTPKKKR